jgi:hypothetical protein
VNRNGRSRASGSGQPPDSIEDFPAAPFGAAGDLDRTTAGTRTMRRFVEQRARLARVEAARAETERMTTSTRIKACQFGCVAATWTRADERDFQANVAALRFERRGELDALTRKLARQAGAIAAFRVRYRISEPAREMVS